MEPSKFVAPEVGKVVRHPGALGFSTFIPKPLPRSLSLDAPTVLALSEADTALGRLAGAGRLLPNPHILVTPYVVREAVDSSRIEGTQASLSDIFQANAVGSSPPGSDVREVQNYIAAMNRGLELLTALPICLRLLREIHGVLMTGVRGRERMPGEFRTTPNWIGSPDDRPETAVFVPPPPDAMLDSLRDLERFANEEMPLPPLIRCALLHEQFETIHPFLDGNGRLGRLLIVFYLVQQGRLPAPLLYLSSYLEGHRQEYYDRLQAVRERGERQEWLQFFLRAVAVQAADAVERAERLADLREQYRGSLAASTRSRAHLVVDLMLRNPVLTAPLVQRELGVTNQGALNLLRQIAEHGFLREVDIQGPGGRRTWIAMEILSTLEGAALPRPIERASPLVTGSAPPT